MRILVVEDDKEFNRTLCSYLSQGGFEVTGCFGANEAYDAMYAGAFDIMISDIMMPEIDGFELAENIRALNKEVPILFITARDDIQSKKRGFGVGVDDYLVKPFELCELVLRINALLRRAKAACEKRLEIGSLVLDKELLCATVSKKEIPLTVREFNMLYKLLSYPRKTFTRTQLMDECRGGDSDAGPRTIDVYITRLRSKFKDCKDFEIVTVHGLGYKAVLK